MTSRAFRGTAFAALVFLLVQLGALALVPSFEASGYQQFENPQNPTNSLIYVVLILVMTALMLAAFRYDFDWVVRAFVVFTSGLLAWYVLGVFLPDIAAIPLSALIAVALWVYPEWYVIDAAGVVMGAGAAGLFGISFGVLPAILLLAVLAVYDAISVYGTEHMLDLAEGVMDLRVPVVLVIPLTLGFSILPDEDAEEESDAGDDDAEGSSDGSVSEEAAVEGEGPDVADRDAFFIGLGDAVMPTVLVASAAHFSPAAPIDLGVDLAVNLPALAAMVGTFLGLFVLLRMVFAGRAHAGLPLLNGGAIGGYLAGSVAAGVPILTALGL
ncbi:presenilin family intramembrane aspartyl protease PSH [Halolamina rubra]|uniref:presenilin family intramembrane aspartyl protease PSH n=1 Tax=Halolamina rubra TaxID=1380430 RepID=UPI00067906F2|nr:presenilin family intramembrane aspartyl protease PSH [Halolamina rubra]